MSAYSRERREARAASLAPDDPRHGKRSTYVNFKCRCDACKYAMQGYQIERNYGITHDDYMLLGDSQNWLCAACGADDPGSRKGWHLDHSHTTGRVRGLLCHSCNVALGMLAESPARISALLGYAQRHAA